MSESEDYVVSKNVRKGIDAQKWVESRLDPEIVDAMGDSYTDVDLEDNWYDEDGRIGVMLRPRSDFSVPKNWDEDKYELEELGLESYSLDIDPEYMEDVIESVFEGVEYIELSRDLAVPDEADRENCGKSSDLIIELEEG